MNNICCIIPARYNSSRLPGKPLLEINSKTILERTYNQVLKSKLISNIYIATDDDKIVDHVNSFKGNVIKVDEECLNGTERICYALDDIDKKYNIIVNVQGDEPFINPENIDYSINKYIEFIKSDDSMVCSTIHYKITDPQEINNRGVGKLITDRNNNVIYCSRAMIPHNKSGIITNTDYLGHIGIFVFKRDFLPIYLNTPNTPAQLSEDIEWLKIIEMGLRIKSFLVESYEIGINTPEDFNYLSKKYSNN